MFGAVTKADRQLRDLGGRRLGKSGRRVDAGPDRGAAERQLIDAFSRILDAFEIVRQHSGIAGPFLAHVIGVASCIWVRPILTMSFHLRPLLIALCKAVTAGINRCLTLMRRAIYIADGNESFDDCDMLT